MDFQKTKMDLLDGEPRSFSIKEFWHLCERAVTPGPVKSEKCFLNRGLLSRIGELYYNDLYTP